MDDATRVAIEASRAANERAERSANTTKTIMWVIAIVILGPVFLGFCGTCLLGVGIAVGG